MYWQGSTILQNTTLPSSSSFITRYYSSLYLRAASPFYVAETGHIRLLLAF
jgi:hypothetical protein